MSDICNVATSEEVVDYPLLLRLQEVHYSAASPINQSINHSGSSLRLRSAVDEL